MDETEAKQKAKEMYEKTKGKRRSIKKDKIELSNEDTEESSFDKIWVDGTESEMFNKLEEIARSDLPQTPVLKATITKTLEPCNVQDDVCSFNFIFKLNLIYSIHSNSLLHQELIGLFKVQLLIIFI